MGDAAAQPKRGHYRGKARHGHRVALTLRRDPEGAEATAAYTRDLGTGGAFIVTDEPLERGATLIVQIALPAGSLEVRAEVRWADDGEADGKAGVGVRFLGLEDAALAMLDDYLDSMTGTTD
jgi:uncharacterized protein (TIGR02266 family)